MKGNAALVVFSGGQDSTTCLYWAKERYHQVHALTFNYGQRHAAEIEAARRIAKMAEIASHEVLEVGNILKSTSPLVSDAKLEQYQDWQSLPGGLEKTFVPGRNALFFVLAANRAMAHGITNIITGICQEDFGGYPDCREDFRVAMEAALQAGLDPLLEIHAPLMFLSKAASVQVAAVLPGCLDALAFSHTAYDGKFPPTGNDHATLLRAKGFEQAGLPDPLVLRAVKEGLMKLPNTSNYYLKGPYPQLTDVRCKVEVKDGPKSK